MNDQTEIKYSYGIRTWDKDGSAYGGFKWDLTVGARTTAPDWRAVKECGTGLHGNKDGLGDWSLLNLNPGKKIGIIRWDSAEEIDLDGKHKFPWAEIVSVEDYDKLHIVLAACRELTRASIAAQVADATEAQATGKGEHASAAGYKGHASAAGYKGHASAAGNYGHASAAGNYGHASAAGDSGHASAAGNYGHASAAGYKGHASAAGNYGIAVSLGIEGRAKASATGAIVLSYWERDANYNYSLKHVFAGMVGQNGIKADTWYALNSDGQPVETTEDA